MINLRNLVNRIRILSGLRNSTYLHNTEIKDLVQTALNYIYNQIVLENENFFLENPYPVQLREDETAINLNILPRKLFKIRSLLCFYNTIPYQMMPISIQKLGDNSEFKYQQLYNWYNLPLWYVLEADKISIYPENAANIPNSYELRCVLEAPVLPDEPAGTNDPWEININLIKGIDDFLAYHTASDCTDVQQLKSTWMTKAKVLEQQVMSWVMSRDTSYLQTIRRVRPPKKIEGYEYGLY